MPYLTITYKRFTFVSPDKIDVDQYLHYKTILTKNKKYKLHNSVHYWPSFVETIILILFFSIICIPIGFWGASFKGTFADTLQVISILLGIGVGYLLLVLLMGSISFLFYSIEKHIYFLNFKKSIINSKDYDDFVNIFYSQFLLNHLPVKKLPK